MSYATAAALQTALFQHLATDIALQGALDGAIYDAVPPATPPATYVLLGTEEATDRSDQLASAVEYRLTISVVTNATGFLPCKTIAALICDRLAQPLPALARGHLVGLWFDRAEARKVASGRIRRVDLRFRARLDDTPIPTP
jgi:hypothetical protein